MNEKVYNNLFPEHQEIDWEQVSLDLLVHEIESAAVEQGLENFKVQVKERNISIIYRDILFPPDSPEITVVGDVPLAFSFEECKNDFSITETNPLTRYREFSFMGIGLGSSINFKIPAFFLQIILTVSLLLS